MLIKKSVIQWSRTISIPYTEQIKSLPHGGHTMASGSPCIQLRRKLYLHR